MASTGSASTRRSERTAQAHDEQLQDAQLPAPHPPISATCLCFHTHAILFCDCISSLLTERQSALPHIEVNSLRERVGDSTPLLRPLAASHGPALTTIALGGRRSISALPLIYCSSKRIAKRGHNHTLKKIIQLRTLADYRDHRESRARAASTQSSPEPQLQDWSKDVSFSLLTARSQAIRMRELSIATS